MKQKKRNPNNNIKHNDHVTKLNKQKKKKEERMEKIKLKSAHLHINM